jgi:hypothetical protein
MIFAEAARDHYLAHATEWVYLFHVPTVPDAVLHVETEGEGQMWFSDTDIEYWWPSTGRSSDVYPAVAADTLKYYVGVLASKVDPGHKAVAAYRENLGDVDDPDGTLSVWLSVLETRGDEIAEKGIDFFPKTGRHRKRVLPIVDGVPLALKVGDKPTPLHDALADKAISEWKRRKAASKQIGRCALCGEEKELASLHPKMALSGTSATVVTCNKWQHYSYGREDATQSAICIDCVLQMHAGVSHATKMDERRLRQGSLDVIVFGGTTDGLQISLADRPDDFLKALRSGIHAIDNTVEGIDLHVTAIEEAYTRLRTLIDTTVPLSEMMENVQRFTARSTSPVHKLVDAAYRKTDSVWKEPGLHHQSAYADFLFHMMLGRSLPRKHYTQWAVRRRHRQTDVSSHEASLITLYQPDMDPTSPAYKLGKLLAAADSVYYKSLSNSPDRYASKRYWRRMIDHPVRAYGELCSRVLKHLDKEGVYAPEFEEAAAGFDDMPERLSPDDQGAMALGFFKARQDMFEAIRQKNGEKGTSPQAETG